MVHRIFAGSGMASDSAVVSHRKLTTVERLGDGGTWELELDVNDVSVDFWRYGTNPTIEVLEQHRAKPAFSGYYKESAIVTERDGTRYFKVWGPDDLGRLGWRWIAPQSDRQSGFTTASYTLANMPAGDTAVSLVEAFAGPNAHTKNVLTDFAVGPKLGLGPQVTKSWDFVKLDREVTSLTVPHGLVARCDREGEGEDRKSVFSVTAARDLTSDVVFYPQFGEVKNFVLRESREEANAVKTLGSGEGAARATAFSESPLTTRFPDYIHEVIDRSNATGAALTQEAAAFLALSGVQLAATATPATDDASRLQYGTDFNLGDLVRLEDGEQAADLQITQCTSVYLGDGTVSRDYVVGPALRVAFGAVVHELKALREIINRIR